jgi:hypothetical protein
MPQFKTDELRAHVARAKAECRRVVFGPRLDGGGGFDERLGMTLPVRQERGRKKCAIDS